MKKLICWLFGHPGMSKEEINLEIAIFNGARMKDMQNGLIEGKNIFYGSITSICPRCGFELNIFGGTNDNP